MGDDADFYAEQQEGLISSCPMCPKCGSTEVEMSEKKPERHCKSCGHTEVFKGFGTAEDGWSVFV
jgi:ribosomal protein S27AE